MLESFTLYFEDFGLIGLFLICFLSATILPFSSEIVLIYFLSLEKYDPILLLIIASFGNCLGGLTNYFLGYFGNSFFLKLKNRPTLRYFKFSNFSFTKVNSKIKILKSLDLNNLKASIYNIKENIIYFFQKKGFYAAFFSWIPIIGDPLLISLGFIKTPFWKTVFFMCLGKVLRYGLLIFFI